jgi:alpha-L-fucosidase
MSVTDVNGHSVQQEGNGESPDAKPAWLKNRLEWFMDQRFGLILHWGPYSQWDCIESWPLVPADTWARPDTCRAWVERGRDLERFSRDYRNLYRTFHPIRFDAERWAAIAEAAGARYVVYTTKHHDGFCMWDTRTTDYRITHPDCPFHADPRADTVREVFAAFRRRQMGIGCYFSKPDWHCPWYWAPGFPVHDRNVNYDTNRHPELWTSFVAFVHCQIEELMREYGPVDILWLDGGQVRPPHQDIRMGEIAAMARRLQPGLIMADRTVGGWYEDFLTPEQTIPKVPPDQPWEACETLGRSWKYMPEDDYKSAREVIHLLIETASKGGNLLLGVGPDALGEIPARAEKVLREIGDWLRSHGEAIYGTRAVPPYEEGLVRFTRKKNVVYAFVLPTPDQRWPEQVSLSAFQPCQGSAVEVVGLPSLKSRWRREGAGCVVSLPTAALSDTPAVVLRLAVER